MRRKTIHTTTARKTLDSGMPYKVEAFAPALGGSMVRPRTKDSLSTDKSILNSKVTGQNHCETSRLDPASERRRSEAPDKDKETLTSAAAARLKVQIQKERGLRDKARVPDGIC